MTRGVAEPLVRKGDSMNHPKHVLKVVHETIQCGDCSGHPNEIATCSCGWKKDLYGVNYPGISYKTVVAEIEHLKHRLEVLEA